jgi:hypothetical protein
MILKTFVSFFENEPTFFLIFQTPRLSRHQPPRDDDLDWLAGTQL